MKKLFSEWKNQITTLRNVSDSPEYLNRIIKGRTEANQYTVGMLLLGLLADGVTILLSALGVIPFYAETFSYILLGGAVLCHLVAVIIGFSLNFSGQRLHYVLFGLCFLSFFFDAVWSADYVVLFIVTPIMLSIRYYDVSFSCHVSGLALVMYPLTHFCTVLFWVNSGYYSFASVQEFFSFCFNASFITNLALIFLFGLAAVFSTIGGRIMILEEAEILSAQTKAELEASEAKTQIMISQIQPHFIYNTLNAICYLCEKEPKTAQDAIADFADYLRENLNFSSKAEMIPFERELEHVKKYLSLEQMRFEDELHVEMDIASSDFSLPSLTVQPLVENAVKHGICHRDGGGTVKISTRENLSYYEIVISDDGVGFDPEKPYSDTSRRHIGLENTRTRLSKMCHGTMKIESAIGQGTKITITLPKEYEL